VGNCTGGLSPQIRDGGEDASSNDIPFDPGEPQFDLVEPGRVSRREVQVDSGMPIQKLGDPLGLVRRQAHALHPPVQQSSQNHKVALPRPGTPHYSPFSRYSPLVHRVRYDRDLLGGSGPMAGFCTCGRDAKNLMALLAYHLGVV
jgi:hypothetical protein